MIVAAAQGGMSQSLSVRRADNGWIVEIYSFNGPVSCFVCVDGEQLKARMIAWVTSQASEDKSILRSVT